MSITVRAAASPRPGKWAYFSITGPNDGWYNRQNTRVTQAAGNNVGWHRGSGRIFPINDRTFVIGLRSTGRTGAPSPQAAPDEVPPKGTPPVVVAPTDGVISVTLSHVTVNPPQVNITVDYFDDNDP